MSEGESIIASAVHGSTLAATVLVEQLRELPVVEKLKKELLAALAVSASQNVVLDLSNVRFVGSVAFLAFLSVRRQSGVSRVILTGLDTNIREVFSLCRLIPTVNMPSAPFEERPTLQDGLEACGVS